MPRETQQPFLDDEPATQVRDLRTQTIKTIAKEMDVDVELVAKIYESEHARIAPRARLLEYMPLFVERATRVRILERKRKQ